MIPRNSAYAVTVLTQPTGQTCNVASGSGTMGTSNVTGIAVACATSKYTVGVTITGTWSGSITLEDNGGDSLTETANGNYTFATSVAYNSPYNVTVSSAPAGSTCEFSTVASGTMGASNVTGITVICMGWAVQSIDFANYWNAVTYGGGTWVAVEGNGGGGPADDSASVAISANGGATWTAEDNVLPSENWMAIAYRNGIFVAVAQDANSVAVSSNGIAWTEHAVSTASNAGFYSVAYGNGMFIATTAYQSAVSSDGITWTVTTYPGGFGGWFYVAAGGCTFVAINDGADETAASADGLHWATFALPVPSGVYGAPYVAGLGYGNGTFMSASGTAPITYISP